MTLGSFSLKKTIIAAPLGEDIPDSERIQILNQRKFVLDKVQNYIDDNLNPKRCNFLDPSKPNYKMVESISDILSSIDITIAEYEKILSISSDDDYQIHLKRAPNSCFVNNYFPDGLLAWRLI